MSSIGKLMKQAARMQQQMEQELGNHVRAQMSDQGAGGSGANNDAVQKAIVDYRMANGNFKTIDDVKKVPGLDPKKVDYRKNRIEF